MHRAKARKRIKKGEQIIVSRAGQDAARLSLSDAPTRRPGRLKGTLHVATDFDAPLPARLLAVLMGFVDVRHAPAKSHKPR